MPEATGIQLAEALQHLKYPPAVVFVTAYSEFALDAFKVNAIDYLVKPVETERLSHALARVREHVLLHAKAQKAERIPVEKGGKKILINIDDIRYVMARDDYAYLQTGVDRFFSTVSLAQLEKRSMVTVSSAFIAVTWLTLRWSRKLSPSRAAPCFLRSTA